MLEVKGLSVRYENRSKPAVTGMDLRVGPGEFVLLTGDSASGKSTAMQAVCGFIPDIIPAERKGEVLIDGKLCDDAVSTARYACMVQQDPETQFCTETVEEEVAFGPENFQLPRDRVREAVDEALRSVGAYSLLERKLSTLSGGEKQKVAIASALAVDPKVLILDEPTSSLDPGSVKEVVGAIETLRNRRKGTVVVVEHRPEGFVHLATRLVTMANGRIAADVGKADPGFAQEAATMLAPKDHPSPARAPGGRASGQKAVRFHPSPARAPGDAKAIETRSLSYEIDGKKILDDVTFDVNEGAILALMGENGSGKTTLIRHLMGLVTPQTGSIRILDHSLRTNAPARPWLVGRDVGLVFQNPNHQLFERTVEKEFWFASENFGVKTDRADAAAGEFEASEGVSRYVHPQCLSFGQKRRVNVVSASAHGPKVLMLDEPFAGQDPKNALAIARMLSDLQRAGKTLIVVTHDPSFARGACTDLLLLKAGRVAANGRVDGWAEGAWDALFEEVWR